MMISAAFCGIFVSLILHSRAASFGVNHKPRSWTELDAHAGKEPQHWQKMSEIATIRSPWMSIFGERLQDDEGKLLDYWRIEKADSAVIVTLQGGVFVLPTATYRPGVGRPTLDFPGGRIPRQKRPINVVDDILKRELGVQPSDVQSIKQLNERGWPINSSFSNQLLFGFVAEIREDATLDRAKLHPNVFEKAAVQRLLSELDCLQCRAVLMEWMRLK